MGAINPMSKLIGCNKGRRWPKILSFSPHWLTNSEVVNCVSDTPEGRYTFSDIALPPRGEEFWDGKMTHNPANRKHVDTYLDCYPSLFGRLLCMFFSLLLGLYV